jgi:hypothetical protein
MVLQRCSLWKIGCLEVQNFASGQPANDESEDAFTMGLQRGTGLHFTGRTTQREDPAMTATVGSPVVLPFASLANRGGGDNMTPSL